MRGGGTISRRRFLRLAGAVSAAALVGSGCRDLGSRGVTIRFWNGFTGPDGRTILKIIKKSNALHEDVQVTMQRMDWGTYYNKLFVAAMSDRAPEVFVVHNDSLERFISAGPLTPVDEVFELAGWTARTSTEYHGRGAAQRGGAWVAAVAAQHRAVQVDGHSVGICKTAAVRTVHAPHQIHV